MATSWSFLLSWEILMGNSVLGRSSVSVYFFFRKALLLFFGEASSLTGGDDDDDVDFSLPEELLDELVQNDDDATGSVQPFFCPPKLLNRLLTKLFCKNDDE
jgi:hypothetical protein